MRLTLALHIMKYNVSTFDCQGFLLHDQRNGLMVETAKASLIPCRAGISESRGTVSNCADAVRLETAPTGERKCLGSVYIFFSSDK